MTQCVIMPVTCWPLRLGAREGVTSLGWGRKYTQHFMPAGMTCKPRGLVGWLTLPPPPLKNRLRARVFGGREGIYPANQPGAEVKMTENKQENKMSFPQRLLMFTCTVLVLAAVAFGVFYGSYRLALANVSHSAAIIWALVEMPLILAGTYGGYRLGKVESRGTLNGLAVGVKAVNEAATDQIKAATGVAEIKVNTARAMRQVVAPESALLPDVIDITPRKTGKGCEVIV